MATEGERVNINSKPSVVSFINSIFGNDLNSLDHAQSIYDEFDKRKHEIESKVSVFLQQIFRIIYLIKKKNI